MAEREEPGGSTGPDAEHNEPVQGDSAPDDTVPDDTVPDDTVQDDSVPDDTELDDAVQDADEPAASEPGISEPVEPEPVESEPAEPESAEPTSAEPTPSKFARNRAISRRAAVTKRVALVSARLTAGLIGVGVAAAAIIAAAFLPLPTLGQPVHSTEVHPVVAAQQRICPGPVLQLGDTSGAGANVANTIGSTSISQASTEGNVTQDALESTDNPKNTPPQRLTLTPSQGGDGPEILAGSQSQRINGAELNGFTAAVCATSAADSWLVGGSTLTGRTTLILLSNPSSVAATVNLQIFSEKGPVTAAGTDGIAVPPGGQRVFSLAGFAPNIATPVIHVVSTGGQVVASLEQSIVRTLDPGGVDLFGATARASTLNVIPGLVLSDSEAIHAMLASGGYEDAIPALRILVPVDQTPGGNKSATAPANTPVSARITLTAEGASTAPVTVTVNLERGVATDVPLAGFVDGNYTVSVATGMPAVVAARSTTLTTAGAVPSDPSAIPTLLSTDFAWFTAAPELHSNALVSVAPGPSPTLHLANASAKGVTVAIAGPGASQAPVTIAPGTTAVFPVRANAHYLLSGFTSLFASVSYHGPGAFAGFAVVPPEPASQPITVYRGVPPALTAPTNSAP